MAEAVPPARPARKKIVRAVMVVAVLAAVWHIAASFLWIAPYSAGARALFPGGQQVLSSYMIPMFGQSWSVFAPEPINGNYVLKVRAALPKDGAEEITDWVDATEVETSVIRHNLFPPRAGIGAGELASEYKGKWDALTADHKVVTALNYFNGNDWPIRLNEKLQSYGTPDVIAPYLDSENTVIKYATQVARAVWGSSVTRVQFQVYRQNVIPFADRNTPGVQPQPMQIADTGWRGLEVAPGQSDKDFADVFKAAYERLPR